ncbi:hypothetical protein HOY80DRAFT_1136123 [Tuber brumale]|nr:hypothetical protein HOY80DRAFT_1136123 [Tuber brumale]
MSFIYAVKKVKSHGALRSPVQRRGARPELAQCKYETVRYELKPMLQFMLYQRPLYPVAHAWYIHNYDKRYLPSFLIAHIESLKWERDSALGMMRDGHMSYLKMVRDAEIAMFGDSPVFGARRRNVRATPLFRCGRSELLSYKSWRGKSARSRALDGFNPKGGPVDVQVKSRAPINEHSSIPNLYAETLDAICQEDMFETASTVTESPPRRGRPIRMWLLFANPTKRQSMDSGFGESRSMTSSEVLMGTPGAIEIHSTLTRRGSHALRNACHQFQSQGCTMSSSTSNDPLGPYYELAVKRVESGVNKAARIRRRSSDSVNRVCRAHRNTITTVRLHQSIETYRDRRKLFVFVKDRLGRRRVLELKMVSIIVALNLESNSASSLKSGNSDA